MAIPFPEMGASMRREGLGDDLIVGLIGHVDVQTNMLDRQLNV